MTYSRLLKWIDRQFGLPLNVRFTLPLLVMPSWLGVMALGYHPVMIAVATLWSAVWMSLFGWRFVVWTRKGDGEYDRRIKWGLSEEYHSTESAAAAAARRTVQTKKSKAK